MTQSVGCRFFLCLSHKCYTIFYNFLTFDHAFLYPTDASSFYIAFIKQAVGDFCTDNSCMGELAQTHFIIFGEWVSEWVCVIESVCVCVGEWVSQFVCVCPWVNECVCVYECVCVCVWVSLCVCVCEWMNVCVYECVCVWTNVCVHVSEW